MPDYVLLTEKQWHRDLFSQLEKRANENWHLIDSKEKFTQGELTKIRPSKIFIPHWSYIIPSEIYDTYECVVFHMTDLPFGRGGSPLQNLIVRGHKSTKLSALKVEKGIDAGGIYLKRELSLEGSATEIFLRTVPLIGEMIEEIIKNDLQPKPQEGDVVAFKRRTPEESNISTIDDPDRLYDHIRMLDAETYPRAFLDAEGWKFEFFNAQKKDNEIIANVRIIKK
jgi:methionyl-tRNA formyltransferase